MGQIHIINEQPGDMILKSELEFIDKIQRDKIEASWLAGPKPIEPSLGDNVSPIITQRGIDGIIRVTGGGTPQGDPNAAALIAIYNKQLEIWNNNFLFFFNKLQENK